MQAIRDERMDEGLRQRLERIEEDIPNADRRLKVLANLSLRLDSFELVPSDAKVKEYDARAYHETWNDMLRLQEEDIYPVAFSVIAIPVIMLHGAYDPHPGAMIHASLKPYLPQLEYREWERCGHYPWLEKSVRCEFLDVLREWLSRQSRV